MHILIAGGSGFIGQQLREVLTARGDDVRIITRKRGVEGAIHWDDLLRYATPVDAIINLAGESIASGRWSQSKKDRLLASRLQSTETLVNFCQNAKSPVNTLINASAIGFYGDHGNEVITEDTKPNKCFSHQLCDSWEQTLAPLKHQTLPRICVARFGVVLAQEGGAYSQLAAPFKMKLALHNGNGEQWFSWVSLEDAVAALVYMLDHTGLEGPYNVTSPNPIKNKQLTRELGIKYGAKIHGRLPAGVLKFAFGEMAEELILASQRVVPDALIEDGFTFRHQAFDELVANW